MERKSLATWSGIIDLRRDLCLDLLRIYLGVGLFVKGVHFCSHASALLQTMAVGDVPFASMALAHYVAMAHLFGGFLLAIGLVTRAAALVQVPVLFGAVFFVHLKEGLFTPGQTLEFSALVLFMLCLFSVCGAGRLSADYYVSREQENADALSVT